MSRAAFCSQALDVERYGLIYAGAQKNAGAAGVTVVIVRDDLIADGPPLRRRRSTWTLRPRPPKGSMLNTPNTFGIYIVRQGVPLDRSKPAWTCSHGRAKLGQGHLLYDLLEHSELFHGTTQADSRPSPTSPSAPATPRLDVMAFVAGAASG